MHAMGPWLRRSAGPLAAVVPGLQELSDWAAPLPADLVDLFALELPLTDTATPPSLHVRVPRDRTTDLRRYDSHWLGASADDALAAVATIAEQGLDAGERGFVCEPHAAGFHLGAAYANVPQDTAVRSTHVAAIARTLGVPARSRILVDRLDAVAEITHVGAMVGRAGTPTRVVVRLRPDTALWPLLETTSEHARAAAVVRDVARTRPASEVLLLNIDILDGRMSPSFGLETKPIDDGQSLTSRSAGLQRLLEESGIDGRTCSTLVHWQGRSVQGVDGGPAAPSDLAALLRGAERPGTLQRVNHVKVTVGPVGVTSVKAYLFVFRVVLRWSEAADDRVPDGLGHVGVGLRAARAGDDEDRPASDTA